ncbi:MAG: hypothetical protein WD226_02665 [Planctomycetota bacterium]
MRKTVALILSLGALGLCVPFFMSRDRDRGVAPDSIPVLGSQDARNGEVPLEGSSDVESDRSGALFRVGKESVLEIVGPACLQGRDIVVSLALFGENEEVLVECSCQLGKNRIAVDFESIRRVVVVGCSGRACHYEEVRSDSRTIRLTLLGWEEVVLQAFDASTGASLDLKASLVDVSAGTTEIVFGSLGQLVEGIPVEWNWEQPKGQDSSPAEFGPYWQFRAPANASHFRLSVDGFALEEFFVRPWGPPIYLALKPESTLYVHIDSKVQDGPGLNGQFCVYLVPLTGSSPPELPALTRCPIDLSPGSFVEMNPSFCGVNSVQIRAVNIWGPGILLHEQVIRINPGEVHHVRVAFDSLVDSIPGEIEIFAPTDLEERSCLELESKLARVDYELVAPSGARFKVRHFESLRDWGRNGLPGLLVRRCASLAAGYYSINIVGAGVTEDVSIEAGSKASIVLGSILDSEASVFVRGAVVGPAEVVRIIWGTTARGSSPPEASFQFIGPGPHRICLPGQGVWLQAIAESGVSDRLSLVPEAAGGYRNPVELKLKKANVCRLTIYPVDGFSAAVNSAAAIDPVPFDPQVNFVSMRPLWGEVLGQVAAEYGATDGYCYSFTGPGSIRAKCKTLLGVEVANDLSLSVGDNFATIDGVSGVLAIVDPLEGVIKR